MNDFAKRFLQVRDGLLTPQESWNTREKPDSHALAAFCFVRPLERIEEEDCHEVLVAAAALPYHYVTIEFRCITTDLNGACGIYTDAMMRFFKPWQDAGIIGSLGGSLQNATQGQFFIGLFPMSVYPPDQFISRNEIVRNLTSAGFGRYKLPVPTSH